MSVIFIITLQADKKEKYLSNPCSKQDAAQEHRKMHECSYSRSVSRSRMLGVPAMRWCLARLYYCVSAGITIREDPGKDDYETKSFKGSSESVQLNNTGGNVPH